MSLKPLVLSFFMIALAGNAYAAGSTINEDFSLVHSICDDMIDLAKNRDQPGFIKLADSALTLSEAQRRDNSLAIDRFRPKIRAAKKAAKEGNFDSAVSLLKEAQSYMKPAPTSWDGGS
jgi:hypothetical protein